MIELSHLRQLAAFAECGTLSKAAETLHISQPSLTRSMREIESSLQVPLFERKKNKLSINDNGKLAVDYARKVLEQMDIFEMKVKEYDKAKRTISIGSCAPAPLWMLLPLLSQEYPGMMITSEIIPDSNNLIDHLRKDEYRMIVLPFPWEENGYVCNHYTDEHLHLSIPPTHRLAGRKSVSFSDFDGENVILFSDLGVWHNIHISKMPNSKFLVQNDRFAFDELVNASVLPCFCTDLSMIYLGRHNNRINIPISDPEAIVSFYIVCHRKDYAMIQKRITSNGGA